MKKYLILVVAVVVLLISGCSLTNLDNTPTKKVEKFLNAYRTNDDTVMTQMNTTVDQDTTLSDAQKTKYKDVLKKQYSDMTYKIKDEVIDGDTAMVTVQIEVYDLYKATTEADQYLTTNQEQFKNAEGLYDNSLFLDYRINQMEKVTDKVTYTIDFVAKKVDKEWRVQDISDADREKLHGLYAY